MLNKVILIGHLTRDPEIRYAPSGTPVANFGIAMNRKYKDGKGDPKEEVCFVDVMVIGKAAESANKYLFKGHRAMIEGRLQMRKFVTKEGRHVTKHEVVAENIKFMQAKAQNSDAATEGHAEEQEEVAA